MDVIDFNCSRTKYILAFIIPLTLFILLTPGCLFELNPKDAENKCKVNPGKIPISMTLTHAIIFALIMFVIYYFYLGKVKCIGII